MEGSTILLQPAKDTDYYVESGEHEREKRAIATIALQSGAGDMIGPVIQGYFAGTTDMDTTLDQLDSKFSELLE